MMTEIPKILDVMVSNNVRTIVSESEGWGILTEDEFREVIRRVEAHEGLVKELGRQRDALDRQIVKVTKEAHLPLYVLHLWKSRIEQALSEAQDG